MKKHSTIIIAGAGGIAEAAGLLLAEWSEVTPTLYIGNRTLEKAQKTAKWIESGTTKPSTVHAFHLTADALSDEMRTIFQQADILLDCLPGGMAPKMARLAKAFHLHYANMTEYVAETNQIMDLALDADTGFVLQTGIAPGYIDVLAHGMFQQFCRDFGVDKVDKIEMKVGALTDHAVAPHFYGFTWSPIGVATEYVKDAIAIRDYKKTQLHSLSEKGTIIINGITYEDDLTSGGAADLPDFLEGKVRSLDYKTLRHPGHYAWVKTQLAAMRHELDPFAAFEREMQRVIPHVEDDRIVLYVAVEGKDASGTLRRRETARLILPQVVGKHKLRAIQTTTAAPMLQAAQMLLESERKGVVLQSRIEPASFLNGNFIVPVYGMVTV
jgi:saccharopine dehydrogenase-like NADP-dependent oxidoreductase